MGKPFQHGVATSGNNVGGFVLPPARTAILSRCFPAVARMGTAISVLLLSDSLALSRSPASRNKCRLGSAALDTPCLVQRKKLQASDRPEVGEEPKTQPYKADGYLTGIKSAVIVPQPFDKVYDSLSADLHLLFGAIEECKDKVKQEDGTGRQVLQRFVKIPFTIGYFSGALKMSMNVANNREAGDIQFDSSHGKFVSKFLASFTVTPIYSRDNTEHTLVELDSRLNVKRLPPPPLKSLVKGVIVRKIDRCMKDLAAFHNQQGSESAVVQRQVNNIQPAANIQRKLNTEWRNERPSIL